MQEGTVINKSDDFHESTRMDSVSVTENRLGYSVAVPKEALIYSGSKV